MIAPNRHAMEDSAPQMTADTPCAPAGSAPAGIASRPCPECLRPFVRAVGQPRQLFCTTGHRDAFHGRWKARGASIAPFAVAARLTRDGTRGDRDTGRAAVRIVNQLIARWAAEDQAAGRMGMVAYTRMRILYGFEPL